MASARIDGMAGVAARFFAVGFLIALAAGILAFLVPERVLKGSAVAPGGVRFIHDKYEVEIFYDRSDWVAKKILPYTAASIQEYPPIGALYIAAPRFFTDDVGVFEAYSLARSAVCFGLLFALTALLLDRFGKSRLRLLAFFLPAFLYFSLWRFDTFPALIVSFAVLAVSSERYAGGMLALAAGVATKVYPLLFLVPLGLRLEHASEPKKARAAVIRGAAAVFVLSAAFLLAARMLGMSPLGGVYDAHAGRGMEPGSIREIAFRGLIAAGAVPGATKTLVALLFGLLQFGAALVLLFRVKVGGKEAFVRSCLYLLLPFVAFGWFFSQQWIIWIAPLALLVAGVAEMRLLVILDLLLFLQFPVLYDVDRHGAAFDAVTVVRTGVLVALWFLNARALSSSGPAKRWSSMKG